MLSVVRTHEIIYYAPFATLDYPRPLLTDEHRDMRDDHWNIDTTKWEDFRKCSAAYWIKFTYNHKRGDITFTLLYDTYKRRAIVEIGPEKHWDEQTLKQWRYNAKLIPRPEEKLKPSGYYETPTLRQTLCDLGFTDKEISELIFSYDVDDFIDLTHEEKEAQELQEEEFEPFEDYDY